MGSKPAKSIVIDDWCYQMLCFSRYVERAGHKDLTDIQRRVRTAMRKFDGDQAKAAEYLGVTRQKIQGHVSLIHSKGWLA